MSGAIIAIGGSENKQNAMSVLKRVLSEASGSVSMSLQQPQVIPMMRKKDMKRPSRYWA